MTSLATAKELVRVLQRLEALEGRRDVLLAALAVGGPKTAEKAPKALKKEAVVRVVDKSFEIMDKVNRIIEDGPKPRTSAEILADQRLGGRTREEQTKVEAEAMSAYDANVDPASDAQKRMIFGILGKQFGIKNDQEMKQIIVGIVAELHHGVKLESISKELSKPWAGDVIDYLEKSPTDKVMGHLKEPF